MFWTFDGIRYTHKILGALAYAIADVYFEEEVCPAHLYNWILARLEAMNIGETWCNVKRERM